MRPITIEEHFKSAAVDRQLQQVPISADDRAKIAHSNVEKLLSI